MSVINRIAVANDASAWRDFLAAASRDQVDPSAAVTNDLATWETWVSGTEKSIHAGVTLTPCAASNGDSAYVLSRQLARPGEMEAARGLLRHVLSHSAASQGAIITGLLARDSCLHGVYESEGFFPVGWQPCKHALPSRESVVWYFRPVKAGLAPERGVSDSVPQVLELMGQVRDGLGWPASEAIHDGATGYPLHGDFEFGPASVEEVRRIQGDWRQNPALVRWNVAGAGYLGGLPGPEPRALVARHGDGLAVAVGEFSFDPVDRCARVLGMSAQDPADIGPMLYQLVRLAQKEMDAVYVEMDALTTATRLLKTSEQLGFVPVAVFPGIHPKGGGEAGDVVRLVKINHPSAGHEHTLTPAASRIVQVVDRFLDDQHVGVAIINLLRELPFFLGLGDGELRKIAHLFQQKLYHPGQVVFEQGAPGDEACVVMRGQVDIIAKPGPKSLATLGTGKVLGEMAFLDGAPRTASAVAAQPSILLVIQRRAFQQLAAREPHLGHVVLRNIAMELSQRLRQTNSAMLAK